MAKRMGTRPRQRVAAGVCDGFADQEFAEEESGDFEACHSVRRSRDLLALMREVGSTISRPSNRRRTPSGAALSQRNLDARNTENCTIKGFSDKGNVGWEQVK